MSAPNGQHDPIAKLAFIGDQRTVCAIDENGRLPLLSFPNLDDPTMFAAALSGNEGSSFSLNTTPPSQFAGREVVAGTNRVVTRFESDDLRWDVTDFMVPGEQSLLVRHIAVREGEGKFRITINPAPDYERAEPAFEIVSGKCIALNNAAGPTFFSASFQLSSEDGSVTGAQTLSAGQSGWVVIGSAAHERLDIEDLVERTDNFWEEFAEPQQLDLPFTDIISRSALASGLLHNREHGGVAAAGTFAFPEAPEGERNWDYRYVWVRDSAVGAKAMARIGYTELAESWLRFVMLGNGSCDRSPLRLMLTFAGDDVSKEFELQAFDGMLGAKPVRVGNEASGQLQLDIFGELAFALKALCDCDAAPADELLDKMHELLDWLADNWNRPDSSIWELRGEEKHYLFSRLMCWIAFRDMQQVFAHCGRVPDERWSKLEDEIAKDIRERFWCNKMHSYMQTSDCSVVDSAVIAMRLFGFLQHDDERWQQSKAKIREDLVKPAGVLRYPHDAEDGFDSEDGTFVLCTCWWIEALWMDGDHDEARAIFDDLVGRFETTGQMSEEIGEDGRLLGNMPQLFSHAGVIEAALRLGGRA